MKLKFNMLACFVVGALVLATQAMAAPFLSVDVNGYQSGQTLGPTLAGYQGWEMTDGAFLDPSVDWGNSGAAGLTKVFPTSEGNITANLVGVGVSRSARNRGANSDVNSDLTSDFAFAARDNAIAFGRNYMKLTLSGLSANTTYEVTGFHRDHFNGVTDSYEAWSDLASLGGLDGPAAWLDANVGAGASYQPAVGGTDNPIPTLARGLVTGPSSADPLTYAATFYSSTDASGVLTVYGWADPNSFSGVQGAALLNGFQLAAIPEPASLALFGFALVGVAIRRVR